MNRLPVYILAGGRSSRFGSDKARALLEGEPLIARLAAQVAPIAAGVTVVADAADKYADLGLRTIADRRPGLGPLAGLEAAILDLTNPPTAAKRSLVPLPPSPSKRYDGPFPWLAVLTCDMTRASTAWIDTLHAAANDRTRIVCFRDAAGRRHPFPGLYHVDLLAPIQQSLDARALAVQALIESAAHLDLPTPPDWPPVAQVNTPDDLRRAARGLC